MKLFPNYLMSELGDFSSLTQIIKASTLCPKNNCFFSKACCSLKIDRFPKCSYAHFTILSTIWLWKSKWFWCAFGILTCWKNLSDSVITQNLHIFVTNIGLSREPAPIEILYPCGQSHARTSFHSFTLLLKA